ncbi:MAG: 4-hydroxythreonine-4-phosphate dehydrogenase PdxA [Muribaculaceae bacterium]|nr:4-hydroxythreonine-4-phosphate dehydrogenase PdxA [Muribaculaceae bacterium]
MENRKLRVGITHGDINGISYEVLLKALENPGIAEMCTPVVYGSAKVASFWRKAIKDLPEVKFTTIESAADVDPAQPRTYIINVIPEDTPVNPGEPTKSAGTAALAALDRATADLRDGLIDVLVTCPINKAAIHGEEFAFPGHTEYLEARLGADGDKAMMIMASENLRVALVTIHTPLADVKEGVTVESVRSSIEALNRSLVNDFGVHAPRIAVLGLNPHAGDGGVIGSEETDIIAPAIAEAYKKKILAFGPYPADGFFAGGGYKKFDGILAMYHDQGLTPFKLLALDGGINFTSGLPYVRTSPDHGTAYDIAGRGDADPQSLREAIYAAIDIYHNRIREAQATANPLRKQNFDRGSDRVPREKKEKKEPETTA